MVTPLLTLFVALTLAYVFSELLKVFKLPRVIGQLGAGFILGFPLVKNFLFTPETTSIFAFFANMGIILLFYFVGLGINLREFKKHAKTSAFISIFNTTIPLVVGFLVSSYLFHLSPIVSLVIGISLAVSAQAVSLDILEEAHLLKSRVAQIIITTGTVDDVFEFLLISVLLVIFHVSSADTNLWYILAGIIAFLLLVVLLRFIIVPFALRQFEKSKSATTLFMGSLIIVILISSLAEVFKIGALIGAVIAGMIVRQVLLKGKHRKPWEEHAIAKSIHLISFGLLVPIFFVWVGMNTTLTALSSDLLLIIALFLITIFGTIAGTIIGVIAAKGSVKEGLIVGLGVLPKGDTELVIATLALGAGLITAQIFSAIVLSAFFVTLIAPLLFNYVILKEKRNLLLKK